MPPRPYTLTDDEAAVMDAYRAMRQAEAQLRADKAQEDAARKNAATKQQNFENARNEFRRLAGG